MAKPCALAPRKVAETLVSFLPAHPEIAKVEIAGPGFINFFMHKHTHAQVIADVLRQGDAFGQAQIGKGQKVLLEYVSANPTGPLHVGHGRGAALYCD